MYHTQHITHDYAQPSSEALCTRKRKRNSDNSAPPEDIAWTAARCMRLLRTISSRINALRQLSEAPNTAPGAPRKSLKRKSDADPPWMPGVKAKSQRKTYANRTARQSSKGPKRPEMKSSSDTSTLPSPFVRRLQSQDVVEATQGSPLARVENLPLRSSRQTSQTAYRWSIEANELEENLSAAFSNLLKATKPSEPPPRRGASSLASTCLRKIPSGLEIEDEEIHSEVLASSTSSLEIYSYLEQTFETGTGTGWSGLRELVRAHALHLICDAFDSGTFPPRLLDKLVIQSHHCRARPEAQKLCTHAAGSSKLPLTQFLTILLEISSLSDGMAHLFRTLAICLDGSPSNVKTLGSNGMIWRWIINLLAQDECFQATNFLQSFFRASCHHIVDSAQSGALGSADQDHLDNFKNLGLSLGVMAIATALNGGDSDSRTLTAQTLHRITLDAIWELGQYRGPRQARDAVFEIATPYLLSSLLLQALQGDSSIPGNALTTEAIIQFLPDEMSVTKKVLVDEHLHDLAARIVGLSERLPVDLDGQLAERLRLKSGRTSVWLRTFAVRLAVAGHERRRGIFTPSTLDLKPPVDDNSVTASSPAVNRFSWDDGMCEWIATTPFKRPAQVSEPTVDKEILRPSEAFFLTPAPKQSLISWPIEEPSPDLLAPSPLAVRCAQNRGPSPIVRIPRAEGRLHMLSMTGPQTRRISFRGIKQGSVTKPGKRHSLRSKENRRQLEDSSDDELAL